MTRCRRWQKSKSLEDTLEYIVAKHANKRAVVGARSDSLSTLYDNLENVERLERPG